MADKLSPMTLAVAKKYARVVGSTIVSITPTATGLHFETTGTDFDVSISDWTAYTPEEKAKLASLDENLLNDLSDDNGKLYYKNLPVETLFKVNNLSPTNGNVELKGENIPFDNTDTQITSDDIQNAIKETDEKIASKTVLGNIKVDGVSIVVDENGVAHSYGEGTLDYEELNNKPKINNTTLTGNIDLETLGISTVGISNDYEDLDNLPLIPTKTSDLTNDNNFSTITELNTALDNHNNSSTAHPTLFVEKLDKTTANPFIKNVTFDSVNKAFIFTSYNDATTTINLPIDEFVEEGRYDEETNSLILVLTSGNEVSIPVTGLIDVYTGGETEMIQVSVNASNVISAIIKSNSVTEEKLSTDLQGKLADLEAKKHTHTNKTILDSTTASFTTEEKTKLSGIEENANNYVLPVSNDTTLGGIKSDGKTTSINETGVLSVINCGSYGTAVGNPVIMDGLQGGVPFSEMVVSGKNLLGIAQHKKIYGNDAAGYWILDDETSRTIIQKLMPNSTYTIKKYDNGNYFRLVLFKNEPTGVNSPALQKVNDATGIKNKYTFITDTEYLWLAYQSSFEESDAIEPIAQLELGTEATTYEPPITGRELTIHACGKNLIKYPYAETTKTQNGITFTQQSDGGIAITGQLDNGESSAFILNKNFRINGTVFMSGGSKNIRLQLNTVDNRNFWDIGNGAVVSDNDVNYIRILVIEETEPIDTVIYPQLETGDTPTEYAPYNGTIYSITPDANPYKVTADVRQVEGLNNIYIADDSEPTLTVSYNNVNPTLKMLIDKLDTLATAIVASNAEAETSAE